jgi:invasion protein IalB
LQALKSSTTRILVAVAVLVAIAGGVATAVVLGGITVPGGERDSGADVVMNADASERTVEESTVPDTTPDASNTVNVASRPAPTPGILRAQYGDWQMSCDTPPGASFEQCAIIQNVTAEDQPNVGLSVIALRTADRQARLLRVLAPLGVLLPNGLGLNIDGNNLGFVEFVRCLPNGCVAEVIMDDELIGQLSGGSTAIFVVFRTPEEGIGIPVSLSGFADGFLALP